MIKNKKILALTIVLMIVVAGCLIFNLYIFSPIRLRGLYQNGEAGIADNSNLISVGVCQVGSESVWRTANTSSIKKALAEENGFFLRFSNARQKQENQIKTIREFISQKVDYIVLAPVTEYGWETVLEEAKEAGIPVILTDRKVEVEDDSLYRCFIGTDMYGEGKKAGEWLEDYCVEFKEPDEEIDIIVLTGTVGSTAEIGRSEGFNSIAQKHPNWNILESVDADFTTTKAREVMRELVKKYDDIDVIVSQNDDMTFGVVEILDEAGITHGVEGDVKIISFDAVKKALRMVRDGEIDADIECNPNQGEMIASVIKDINRDRTVEKINYIGDMTFTIYNVNGYINSRNY